MNRSFQKRLDKAVQGVEKLPASAYTEAENQEWAEAQLAELMRGHRLSRKRALALAQEHAPTIYEMLMLGDNNEFT
jgi:hypothetical protein